MAVRLSCYPTNFVNKYKKRIFLKKFTGVVMAEIKIEIDKETADAILLLEERYFFNLFKQISKNEEEEYKFRDAIVSIAEKIKKEIR